MKIDIESIRDLAKNIEKYNLTEIELESNGEKITLKKGPVVEVAPINNVVASHSPKIEKQESDKEYYLAPMAGTFYAADKPNNPPFVHAGSNVSNGDRLFILDVMKLMNEIRADRSFEILEVLVENGQVVKKDDKIFAIKG